MKTNLLIFLFVAIFLNACNVGVNKDLLTGLKMTNSGLSYEDSYLQMDTAKINTSEFETGKEITLFVTGIKGFTEKAGMVFLGGSLDVFDEKGNKIMDNPDLFASYDQNGVSPQDASVIRFSLTIGSPMVSGSKYTWKSKIWDKNGKGTIDAEIGFTVK